MLPVEVVLPFLEGRNEDFMLHFLCWYVRGTVNATTTTTLMVAQKVSKRCDVQVIGHFYSTFCLTTRTHDWSRDIIVKILFDV